MNLVHRELRIGFASLAIVAALVAVGCSGSGSGSMEPITPPFRVSEDECLHLLDIEPTAVRRDSLIAPASSEAARDAIDPKGADLSHYGVVLLVEQTITNLLDRTIVIEAGGATITDPNLQEAHEAEYTFEEPIVLGPHESRSVEMRVTILASEASPDYVLGLVEGSFADARVAPWMKVTIPDSDNCGYADGIIVRAREGTLKVRRPVGDDVLTGIISGILKAFAHG
ncbi:MAG TPA: hypothetical protein VG937_09640 [Polyangiaceae bacterium]|nr:hypothetical protein [Polyangiaceae bacterium]